MHRLIEYKPHSAGKLYNCDECGKLIIKGEWYIRIKTINIENNKLITKHIHFNCRKESC